MRGCPYKRRTRGGLRGLGRVQGLGLGAWVSADFRERVIDGPTAPDLWYRASLVRTRPYDDGDPPPEPLCGPQDVANLLDSMRYRATEQAVSILVDDDMVPLAVVPVGQGGSTSTARSGGDLARAVLVSGATGVIDVHNHPTVSAHSEPPSVTSHLTLSPRDWAADQERGEFYPTIGVRLVDSVVIGARGGYASAEEGREMQRAAAKRRPLLEF